MVTMLMSKRWWHRKLAFRHPWHDKVRWGTWVHSLFLWDLTLVGAGLHARYSQISSSPLTVAESRS
jgi:hypothetical protein